MDTALLASLIFCSVVCLYAIAVQIHFIFIMRYETRITDLLFRLEITEAKVVSNNFMPSKRDELLTSFDIRKLAGKPWRRPSRFYGEVDWANATILKPGPWKNKMK